MPASTTGKKRATFREDGMIRRSIASIVMPLMLGLGLAAAHAETLKIGMVQPLTGPAAESGKYQTQGARLAIEAVNKNGGVLGKQVELVVEDDQTTNPGAVLA